MSRSRLSVMLVALLVSLAGNAQATEEQAIQACQDRMRSEYDVNKFRNVFAERSGNHKYRVYGKVKIRGDRYPFSCRVKRGDVRSYSYNGPHGDRHKNSEKNLAIGVGLAALAAAAIIASNKNSNENAGFESAWDTNSPVDKEYLEDECHDTLASRIRHEHDDVKRVRLNSSQLGHQGRKLTGRGHIRWDYGHPSELEFMCQFDRNGRVIDSYYSYY